MAKYTRNINVKKYASIEEVYDSVNNDPKRPGFQIAYLDHQRAGCAKWQRYLERNGFYDITIKHPTIGHVTYTALIIEATEEKILELKICF